MSKQITVRLPDDMVANIDALIADGATSSRASFVESALEREFRRRLAERDVEILMALKASGEKDDFDDLAEWGAHQPLGID